MKRIMLALVLLAMAGGSVLAVKPADYFLSYKEWSASDSSYSYVRVYCQGGQKFRMETEIQFAGRKMLTVNIIRFDKKLSWVLDTEKKTYTQLGDPGDFRDDPRLSLLNWAKMKKTGTGKVLGYACEILTPADSPSQKYWVNRDLGLMLRYEQTAEDDTYYGEAGKLTLVKQADALFEIPQGYKQNAN